MSDEVVSQTPAEKRQAWLRHLCDEFVKLAEVFPIQDRLHAAGTPDWVANLEREVGSAMFPLADLKNGLELFPRRVGAALGHACGYAVWMQEALYALGNTPPDQLSKTRLSPAQRKADRQELRRFQQWYNRMRRLAKRALSSAVDQTYDDMTEFLLAYAQAFARKPKKLGMPDIGSSAFRIQFVMLNQWRQVSLFKSVHQLHAMLVKIYGSHQVGDLKRIEKICQRIGLSYRKPGRPRKLEVITTAA